MNPSRARAIVASLVFSVVVTAAFVLYEGGPLHLGWSGSVIIIGVASLVVFVTMVPAFLGAEREEAELQKEDRDPPGAPEGSVNVPEAAAPLRSGGGR